ncbi:MAG: hypothetical protein JO168_17055 [Solirubrobacterales bacterium]|nr:hypothetical protein [Solirubrobacterales bacterium]
MADAGGPIEYYKLASAVIPVLWLGNVIQYLAPEPSASRQSDLKKMAPDDPMAAQTRRRVAKHYRLLAMLAVVALPIAVVSETASLYGVYDNDDSPVITVVVTVGLALGCLLVLWPLFVGWWKTIGLLSGNPKALPRVEQRHRADADHVASPLPSDSDVEDCRLRRIAGQVCESDDEAEQDDAPWN